ncbi:MAG: lytic transglycosylase domain-containing protein, partial [Selenomonas sp.]|nr:lytic transglycosylase domain-containing protein [Selenomonas sp.]
EEGLHEPDRNIRYGTWYLATLQKEFHGNDVLALAAYNAGRGNVQEWMKENDWSYDFADIEAIPFKETREYVRQVLADQKKYRELYPE